MTGLKKFDEKQRRLERRRNHIAKDLIRPLYRQRVVKDKTKEQDVWDTSLELDID